MKRSVQYLLTVGIFTLLISGHANAAADTVVISHIQAGAASGQTAAAMQEVVVIYNNSAHDVEVTNWCLSNNRATPITFACVKSTSSNQKLYLATRSYLTVVSDHFSVQHGNYLPDVIFPTTNNSSGSISASGEALTLKDGQGNVRDFVGQSHLPFTLSGGFTLQRQAATDDVMTLRDTDNLSDFNKMQGIAIPVSGVYEVMIDFCSNIDGIQSEVPYGYELDETGSCLNDVCLNIDGLQLEIPEEYIRGAADDCVFDYVALQVTELLANAAGSDIGREYIELYNPTLRDAFLINYALKIGNKTYNFPSGLKIAPGQYMAFYNSEIPFTLVNTVSYVALLGDDGSVISQSDAYESPKDDMAWALIDEVWQYTNQMTFGVKNTASIFLEDDDVEEVDSALPACAVNQYRHPETNRCRLLVSLSKAVVACKDGQYRSEETNRCRSITLGGGTLIPCKENQYRSEETNRCRNLVTLASTLTPCKDNQYRSEETNRCRTIPLTSVPAAAFAVEPIADTDTAFVGWWVLGGLGVLALGYGAWEWRREVIFGVGRFWSFLTRR